MLYELYYLLIISFQSAPYEMLKESSEQLEGNNRYEGFGIELIEELAKINDFNYTFEIQADGVYGSYDKNTGKWNGMMEKVMDGVNIVYVSVDKIRNICNGLPNYLLPAYFAQINFSYLPKSLNFREWISR